MKSITLIELLVTISILGLLIIGLSSIDTFSRYHLSAADQRSRLQNELSGLLEHMAKNLVGSDTKGGAIGDINNPPIVLEDTNLRVKVHIDADKDGQRDDYNVSYQYNATNYQVWFYSNYTGDPSDTYEVVAKYIKNFSPTYSSSNNYLEMNCTTCWDPDGSPNACGSLNNPNVTMMNRIEMPAVSTN